MGKRGLTGQGRKDKIETPGVRCPLTPTPQPLVEQLVGVVEEYNDERTVGLLDNRTMCQQCFVCKTRAHPPPLFVTGSVRGLSDFLYICLCVFIMSSCIN